MTSSRSLDAASLPWHERLLARFVVTRPGEVRALLLSFAFFFCVLCAYYIVRPLRDSMGVRMGKDSLPLLFTLVFLLMLAAVPVFGWVVSTFRRERIVPVVYGFIIGNLVLFWLLFTSGIKSPFLAGAFYIWVNVSNLFLVSLFWSTMADLWSSDQAKRLYGFIAAGGTAGAVCGPLLTLTFSGLLGVTTLFLLSGIIFTLAVLVSLALRRTMVAMGSTAAAAQKPAETATLADLVAGAVNVWRSPYLFRIALMVMLATIAPTFLYLELNRIVGETIPNEVDRVRLFTSMDLAVNILTIVSQIFVTGRVMEKLGLGLTASMMPAAAIAFMLALAIAPALAVIVTASVTLRALSYAFANPAMRVFYTVVTPEDKFKAQNFNDTVVYRGGDTSSAWLLDITTRTFGLTASALALLSVPLIAAWLWIAWRLGADQARLAERQAATKERTPSTVA